MKRIFSYISLLILSLMLFVSCDDIKALMSLIPKFEGELPCIFSGKFNSYLDDNAKEDGFLIQYKFDSSEMTFVKTEASDREEGIVSKGKFTYSYDKFIITEANGILNLEFEDGRKESFKFYYLATAINGPEYIYLDDGKTYYYEGK